MMSVVIRFESVRASIFLVAFAVASVFGVAPTLAVNTTWDVANGDWSDPNNWDTLSVPTSTDNVFIENGGTAEMTANADGQIVNVNVGTVNHTAGTLTTSQWLNIGHGTTAGTGTYNLAASATIVKTGGNLSLGQGNGALVNGIMNSAGTYNNGGEIIVGEDSNDSSSTGELNVTGGLFHGDGPVSVGKFNHAVGEINVSGGTFSTDAWLNIASEGGHDGATGSFNLSGTGSAEVAGRLRVGTVGNASYSQTGGTFLQTGEWVQIGAESNGVPGVGNFNMSGGDFTAAGAIQIGFGDSGSGVVLQTGGTINAINTEIGQNGFYNLDGGILNLSGLVTNAGGLAQAGAFDITGGTLTMDGDQIAVVDALVGSGIMTGYGGAGSIFRSFDGIETIVTATIPEPGTLAMVSIIAGGFFLSRRRSR